MTQTAKELHSIMGTKPRLVEARARDGEPRMKLSIIMPVYNEDKTIARAAAQVLQTRLPCDSELIVVNDGSTDGTTEILGALNHPRARVIEHPRNLGKGAALLSGASVATGSHLVPFDADLEYDPEDLVRLIGPVMRGRCDVVYGVRLFGSNTRYQSYRHALGNRAMTFVASVLFDAALSDMHTCLKVIPVDLFMDLDLREGGFGLDTEVTAKLLARGISPFEIPVSYHSRSIAAGKKITWRDGVECLQVLGRVRAGRRPPSTAHPVAHPLDALAASIDTMHEIHPGPDFPAVRHEVAVAAS